MTERALDGVSTKSPRVEADLDRQLVTRNDGDAERIVGALEVSSRLNTQPVTTFLERGQERQVLDDQNALKKWHPRWHIAPRLNLRDWDGFKSSQLNHGRLQLAKPVEKVRLFRHCD